VFDGYEKIKHRDSQCFRDALILVVWHDFFLMTGFVGLLWASFDHLVGARYSSGAVGGGRKTASGIQSLARIDLASSRST